MLQPFSDRVQVVETDIDLTAEAPVDLTLYDTFGRPSVDPATIDAVVSDPTSGIVAVYTWDMQPKLIDMAIKRGCRGYLDKTLSAEELVEHIEAIADGEVVTSPPHEELPDSAIRNGQAWPGKDAGLTPREAEVVALITQGLTNTEIAARSFISVNSLKSYIRSAYRKMGVERRAQAVRWGIEHGLKPQDDKW